MFQYDKHQSLEHNIRAYLTDVRQANPTNYRVQKFKLFTDMKNGMEAEPVWTEKTGRYRPYYKPLTLSVALFNKTVGDMKKAGIIRTAQDSQEVYLSDYAWNDFLSAIHRDRLATPPGLVIKIVVAHLIDKGVFSNNTDIVTKLVECGLVTRDPNSSVGISGDPTRVGEWLSIQEAEFDKKNASNEVSRG